MLRAALGPLCILALLPAELRQGAGCVGRRATCLMEMLMTLPLITQLELKRDRRKIWFSPLSYDLMGKVLGF